MYQNTLYFNSPLSNNSFVEFNREADDLSKRLFFDGSLVLKINNSCNEQNTYTLISNQCQLNSNGIYCRQIKIKHGCTTIRANILFQLTHINNSRSKITFSCSYDVLRGQSFLNYEIIWTNFKLNKIVVDESAVFNLNCEENIDMSVQKETSPPFPAECDGGCYCWCNGEDIGFYDESYMCSGTYRDLQGEESILPGEPCLIVPVIKDGQSFDYMIINGKVYADFTPVRIIANENNNITIKTVPSNRRIVATNVTISGDGTADVTKTIPGLTKGKTTKFVVEYGYIDGTIVTEYESSCDGCYCWCGDEEVGENETCYDTSFAYERIPGGTYITTCDNAAIDAPNSLTNVQLSIPFNEILSFSGQYNTGTTRTKTITISKIEQYD